MADIKKRLFDRSPKPPSFAFRTCASLIPKGKTVLTDQIIEEIGFSVKEASKKEQIWQYKSDSDSQDLLILLHHEQKPSEYVEFPLGSGRFTDINWFGEIINSGPSSDPREGQRHLLIATDILGRLFEIAHISHSNMANPRLRDWRHGSQSR
jgi:hypothetical protein